MDRICQSTGDGNHGNTSCPNTDTPAPTPLASLAANLPNTQDGNPIHVVTGNKYQAETDLAPLPGTLGLRFTRHYNSQSTYNGPLGYGWSHSFDLKLTRTETGYHLRQADGRGIDFTAKTTSDAATQYVANRIGDRGPGGVLTL